MDVGGQTLGLLRFTTAGSVDDGKSTLIGRLLYDTRTVYEDQLEAVRSVSRDKLELAFFTDGLRAEREQGITIDVAYRYFATDKRCFRIADTPGHEQYTRNMATGASTADLAVIILDARKGLLTQTQRHASIAHLLGIRQIVLVVNKMDLVSFRADVFQSIAGEFRAWAGRLGDCRLDCMPVCARDGDNVAERSGRMDWYAGPSLLEYLETVPVDRWDVLQSLRLPVQYVVRNGEGERAYAGRIEAGSVAVGDDVLVLPSHLHARVSALPAFGLATAGLDRCCAPMSAAVMLDRHLDIGRGDMICAPDAPPVESRLIEAQVVWMAERPLECHTAYLIKHTAQQVCAEAVEVCSRLNIETLEEMTAAQLALNEIGRVVFETHRPIFCDPYRMNRVTGSFIVIDPATNRTVGAGMIERAWPGSDARAVPHQGLRRGLTVWCTGLSCSGKSTLCRAVYERLWAMGLKVEVLDGDVVRQSLCKELGFSKQDRDENIRRIGFVAELLTRNGVIVLVSAISPYRAARAEVRAAIGNFIEVYVNAPLSICESRDLKGLYRKARRGELPGFTGIDDPYEPPESPEIECRTDRESLQESVEKVMHLLKARLM